MSRSQLNRGNSARNPQGDDAGCNILHIDMDAFFALVEVRENPSLAGKQVIVGYDGNRGVVLSATYEARKLGVHSAMPMSRALRLAPNAIVVEPDHEKYSEVSENVMAIFESITPLVQPLSVDEAFLDISGAQKLMGTPSQIGEVIRARVSDEQGITCSVGVASTMFVAKLATNFAKPDGLHVVPADKVIEFLHPLPIGALWGVGEKTAEQLSRLGLVNVSDIANTPVKTLARVVGQAAAEHLYELSWGRDPRTVTPNQAEKSIGAERTFESDIDDPEEILAQILDLSNKVAKRLRAANYFSRTITIKVRFADFTSVTRSKSLPSSTDLATDIYATSKSLFEAMHLQRARIRLVGVRATGLVPTSESSVQLEFSERDSGWREAEEAMDQVSLKFGNSAVKPARLIKPES
ncbi:MAG: DNA polymerase IV [Actinobacteria bacterium]|jgi:DNA polymerase IV|nr:DNA polymerase IV [Actinomycetota bacterium]